jgi:hypothetical protein
MIEKDLLPRLYSQPNCQGEMTSVLNGDFYVPYPVKSLIVPLTFQVSLVDSEQRWTSLWDHSIHGEFVDDTDEIIEQWMNSSNTKTNYQSWSEADVIKVQQGDVSYYDLTTQKCKETHEPEWCQYMVISSSSDTSSSTSSTLWIVFVLTLFFFIAGVIILTHLQKNKWRIVNT